MKMSFDEISRTPQRSRLSLGSILVRAGVLSEPDVRRITQVKLQAAKPLHFSEAAIRMGMVTENELRYALAHQFAHDGHRPGHVERVIDGSLLAAADPYSEDLESIRTIRTQLMLRWYDKSNGHNALAVASSSRGDGRSHLAASLAIAFSQSGENVLLIDGDLRRPSQHELLDLDNRVGLSTLLSAQTMLEPIIHVQQLPGLFVMPSGPVPPNPLELFCRPLWAQFLAEAKETFDVLVIDTPALAAGEDAVLTASRAGAALVVARSGETRLRAFLDMVRGLSNSGIEVVGSVLNEQKRFTKGKKLRPSPSRAED
jgi:protein-tyrosine kinase